MPDHPFANAKPHNIPMSDLIRLMSDSSIIINRVATILEDNGIPFLIKDNTESGRLAGFGTSQNDVDIHVKTSDFEKAKELVQTFMEEQ